ncbi:hypothetical protein GCM10023321_13390 [Pseudonocardia eucalypti]|uniref:Uncharacterized protein n=1 Tax=Pseudonocardia eucalypti TaxID=648755 RepID=A0ABP9PNC8_9PSEU
MRVREPVSEGGGAAADGAAECAGSGSGAPGRDASDGACPGPRHHIAQPAASAMISGKRAARLLPRRDCNIPNALNSAALHPSHSVHE